jgi:adhesin/invasin
LAGVLRRLPKAVVKPVALITAGAIALGGVTLAQSWMSSQEADAVTRNTANWNGNFSRDILWLTNLTGSTVRGYYNPQNLAANTGAATALTMFDGNGSTHGEPEAGQETAAVGPIFKPYSGSTYKHMVMTSAGGTTAVYIDRGNGTVDGYPWGSLPDCPNTEPGQSGTSNGSNYSSEINQKNGYMYVVGGSGSPSLNGGTNALTGVQPRILRVGQSGGFTCLSGAKRIVGMGDRTINTQWNAMTGYNYTGNWSAGSDMAIDANGNLYLFLTASSTAHALLRVVVPTNAGEPTGGTWRYEVVKAFLTGSTTDSAVWGMAFMDGDVYTAHASNALWRWNPLSGTATNLGQAPGDPADLAGGQAAVVIEGTVYNDLDGDGVVDENGDGIRNAGDDPGAPNVTVELFEGNAAQSSTTWTNRGTLTTNSDGNYSALLPSSSHEFAVRVKRPVINTANAFQTYASAGTYTNEGLSNTVTPNCVSNGVDYVDQTASGPCFGARFDGVDALDVSLNQAGDPFGANGAAIVSHVLMNTDQAVVRADFGISKTMSWPDSPISSTATTGGPYANPLKEGQNYLRLGTQPGSYTDGVADPNAAAHPTDDGLEFAPANSLGEPTGNFASAQGKLMVPGKSYIFRAQAQGNATAVSDATLKAWITGVTGNTVDSSFSRSLLGDGTCSSTPDAQGYVTCVYVPAPLSSGGPATIFARVMVGASDITPTTRGPASSDAAATTKPWVPVGDVEDYELGIAPAVIRPEARTMGGVAANVGLSMTNVSTLAPSVSATTILTGDDESYVPSPDGHGIASRTSSVVITTTGVGEVGATSMYGWKLSSNQENSYCEDTGGDNIAVNLSVNSAGTAATVSSPGGQLPEDITCYLTYIAEPNFTNSTVTADKSDNEADPEVYPAGYSAVELSVVGTVRNAQGQDVPGSVEGELVNLNLVGRPGTPADGAYLAYSTDGGTTWTSSDQSYTCALGSDGNCAYPVRVMATAAGGYNLTAAIGTTSIKNAATGLPSSGSPVVIYFVSPQASEDDSFMTITHDADQKANHDLAGSTAADWGKQTISVTLRDSTNRIYKNGVDELRVTAPLDGVGGVYYANVDGTGKGVFSCQEGLTAGLCESGVYTLDVYASVYGDKNITVYYTPTAVGGDPFTVKESVTNNLYVTASFVSPPPDPDISYLVLDGSSPYQQTLPGDPAGVGIPQLTGFTFTPAIYAWDASGQNAVPDARVRFTVPATCVGSFTGGVKQIEARTATSGPNAGRALVQITSAVDGSCEVTGEVFSTETNDWEEVTGSTKTVTWTDRPIDYSLSYFSVSDAEVIANNTDSGTISVTLIDEFNQPITTSASVIEAHGASGSGITVSTFSHTGNGVYTATFTGTLPGLQEITVTGPDPANAANRLNIPVQVTNVGPPPVTANKYAKMIPDSGHADTSFLIFAGTGQQTLPGDPDGVGVEQLVGTTFLPRITVRDAADNYVIPNADVRFTLENDPAAAKTCSGTFAEGAAPYETRTSALGLATVSLRATQESTCVVRAYLKVGNNWEEIDGSPKTATWIDDVISDDKSFFSVSTDGVVADGVDTGTISVTLIGENDERITSGASSIEAHGPNGAEISVDAFSHVANGVYTATFTGLKIGDHEITVTVPGTPNRRELPVEDTDPGAGVVLANREAHMIEPPPSATESFLIFSGTGQQTSPGDPAGLGITQRTGVTFTPQVQAWDGNSSNVIKNTQVRFTLDDAPGESCEGTFSNGLTNISDTTGVDGKATVSLRATVAGSCTVTAEIWISATNSWEEVTGSPKTATWEDGPIDESASYFTVSTEDVVADEVETGTITVTLISEDGLPITTGADALNGYGPASVNMHVGPFTYDASVSAFVASFWGQEAGHHAITVESIDEDTNLITPIRVKSPGGNGTANLVAGPVDPARTVASLQVDPNTALANGSDPVAAWMTVQDKFGNPISGDNAANCVFLLDPAGTATVWFGSASQRYNPGAGSGYTGANGRCSVQARTYTPGNYAVTGNYGGETSPEPPGGRPTAKFNNVVLDPARSWWTVEAPTSNSEYPQARADEIDSYIVTINGRGANDEIANLQSVTIYWTHQASGASYSQTVTTGITGSSVAGEAKFEIKTPIKGVYDIQVKTGSQEIGIAPNSSTKTVAKTFVQGPAYRGVLGNTTGAKLYDGSFANAHRVWVTVYDAKDNLVTNSNVHFVLDSSKHAQFVSSADVLLGKTLTVQTSGMGVAELRVTSDVEETTTVNAYLGNSTSGTAVGYASLRFEDVDGPSAANSTFVLTPDPLTDPEVVADGSEYYEGTLTVRTAHNLPVGAGYTISGFSHDAALTSTGSLTTDVNSQVKVRFTTTKAATYQVNALVEGDSVPVVDQRIKFVPDDADPDTSELHATTEKVLADGVETNTVWVIVRDGQGNAKDNVTVHFSIAEGSNTVNGPTMSAAAAVSNTAGRAEITVSSEEPGSFAVDAYLDSARTIKVSQSPQLVRFGAGEPDPSKSSRTVTPNTDPVGSTTYVPSNGTSSYAVEVTLVSAKNILVDGNPVRLRAFGDTAGLTLTPVGSGVEAETGTPLNGIWGKYTWQATSRVAKTYTAQVEAQISSTWTPIGATVKLIFKGDDPTAGTSWLIQPGAGVVADGSTLLNTRVRAKDVDGNDSESGVVQFSVPTGLTAVVGGVETVGGVGVRVEASVVSGYADVGFRTDVAGTYQVSAWTGDPLEQILSVWDSAQSGLLNASGVVSLEFGAGPGRPDTSSLTIPTNSDVPPVKIANGVQSHRAEVVVRDGNNNLKRNGTASVRFYYTYRDLDGVEQSGSFGPVGTDASGVAAWQFTSLVATTFHVSAALVDSNGVDLAPYVSGSPVDAVFGPDIVNPDKTLASFSVDSSVKNPDNLASARVWMVAQDVNGNPIPNVDLRFLLDYATDGPLFGDGLSGVKQTAWIKSGADGVSEAFVRSVYSGDFDAQGGIGTQWSAAKQVHFSSIVVDPDHSDFSVVRKPENVGDPARADGSDSYVVTVTLRDANDVPVNNASATVYFNPVVTDGGSSSPVTVFTGGGVGQGTVELKTRFAGTWSVEVAIGADRIGLVGDLSTKLKEVVFIPGPVASARMVGPSGPAQVGGAQTQVVDVVLRDTDGNLVSGGPVVFAVPAGVSVQGGVSGPQSVTVNSSDGSGGVPKGVARLVLVSDLVGTYPVSATVSGVPSVSDSPVNVVFVNSDLVLGDSEFTIPSMPVEKTVLTGYHTPRVVLRDTEGNLFVKESLKVQFDYQLEGTSTWVTGAVVDSANGVAQWDSFTVGQAGTHQVRARVVSGAVQGRVPDGLTTRPAVFVPGPESALNSEFTYSLGLVLPDDSSTHWVQVVVRDAQGNLVTRGVPVTFSLSAKSGVVSDTAHFAGVGGARSRTVTSSSTGVARVEVASPNTLITHVTAVFGADDLVGEADLEFANVDTDNASWVVTPTVAGDVVANGVASYTATVTVLSGANLPVPNTVVDFPGLTGTSAVRIVEPGPYVSDASGVLVVTLVSNKAASYTVNAQIGAKNIPVVNQVVTFVAGPISFDPDLTFLRAEPGWATADGVETRVVTAKVADADGNAEPGAWVRFVVPADTSAVGGFEKQTDANGEVELVLTSTTAGIYEVTAEAKKDSAGTYQAIVGGSPAEVEFRAGVPNGAHSVISATPAGPRLADGVESYTVSVAVKDVKDNPVLVAGNAVVVTFTAYQPDGVTPKPGVAPVVRNLTTNGSGVASTGFATTVAGVWKAVAVVANAQASGSPLGLVFDTVDSSAGLSRFSASPENVLADGLHKSWAQVLVQDLFGNPKSGVPVTFTIESGASGVQGPDLVDAETSSLVVGGVVESCDYWAAVKPAWCTAPGLAYVEIISEEPGTFTVSALIGGQVVRDAPSTVSFNAGAVDPSKSSYSLAPDTLNAPAVSVVANGQDSYSLTVTVNSASNIRVPGAHVKLVGLSSLVSGGSVDGFTGVPTSSSYGTYTWTLTSTTSGVYTGRVQVETSPGVWADIQDPATQFTLRFRPDDPSAAASWLVQPPAGVAGVDHRTVVAQVRDPSGNRANEGDVVFHIPTGLTVVDGVTETPGGPGVTVTVPVANGEAAIEVKAAGAITYTVTAGIDGPSEDPINTVTSDSAGLTVLRNTGEVFVTFSVDIVSPNESELSIVTAGLTRIVDVDNHTAHLLVRDASGNSVSNAPATIQWTTGDVNGPTVGAIWNTGVTGAMTDSNGIVEFEFGAPNHAAVWVWVRAFVYPDGLANPPAAVTEGVPPNEVISLKKAWFEPGPVYPGATSASFETYQDPVLNDFDSESWARIVVQDANGNGKGGVKVTFTLPASQAGALGTPVFADGSATPILKTIEVTSCDYDLDPVPTRCLLDGVYTPGLAYIPIISEFEGVFPVTASVDNGILGVVNAGPDNVTFDAGGGSASASWFSVVKTNSASPVVRADEVASYTLTATVMNGLSGAQLLPVSGACVTPELPAGVSVKQPGPSSVGCNGANEYVTDLNGTVKIEIVSRVAGYAAIGVKLGGSSIATVPDGTETSVSSLFVGGVPSDVRSDLIGTDGPRRADDVNGIRIGVTILDQFDNIASCWNGAVEDACEADLYIPGGTWVIGPDGQLIANGPGMHTVDAGLNNYDSGVTQPDAGRAEVHYRGIEGIFEVYGRVTSGEIKRANGIETRDGSAAIIQIEFTDSTSPSAPDVDPTDGTRAKGKVQDIDKGDAATGDLVAVVKDSSGIEITRCDVKTDGTFSCPLNPALTHGTVIDVVIEDANQNQSDPTRRVVDGESPNSSNTDPTKGDVIEGTVDDDDLEDAKTGDLEVVVVDPETGEEVCRSKVNPDGTYRCEFEDPFEDEKELIVKIVDSAGNESDEENIVTDSTPPTITSPGANDGTSQTGRGEQPGNTIIVRNDEDEIICETKVRDDLTWTCTFEPALEVGDITEITEIDPAKNQSSRPWRVGVPEVTLAKAELCGPAEQSLAGMNFQPGETVKVLVGTTEVGSAVANDDGQVQIKWNVAANTPENSLSVIARGDDSGDVTAKFAVICPQAPPPPSLGGTGAEGVVPVVGVALGLVLAGFFLILAAWRRRKEREAATVS